MKNNWVRKIIGGLSFTSAMFIFQACYGTPQDFGQDLFVEGLVQSKATGQPIKGIKVSVTSSMQYEYTDAEGKFSFYTTQNDNLKFVFEDVDSTENGTFAKSDTVVTDIEQNVYLRIELEEE
ncbi:radical SAM-associated putative lipoprotein [uncultured Draconibacterium sp.]|uniref:radical SAM-associated putative lipoprotein n=1 Tax=uncultured Draconibacterium sp. TaxID=1573823 RepID=UPI0032170BBA